MSRPSEEDARQAMTRVPPELHRLLLWLMTGKDTPADTTRKAA